jgi:hypothetical protein
MAWTQMMTPDAMMRTVDRMERSYFPVNLVVPLSNPKKNTNPPQTNTIANISLTVVSIPRRPLGATTYLINSK